MFWITTTMPLAGNAGPMAGPRLSGNVKTADDRCMTSLEQSEQVRDLDAARAEFHGHRTRVSEVVGGLSRTAFDAYPPPIVTRAITGRGHFSAYDAEVAWSARLVVGHLGDSARIFAERIHRVRTEVEPRLFDFVTDEPARIDRYLNAVPGDLLDELEIAQDSLEAALAEVHDAELPRTATHEVDGPITLGDIVAFLPRHQRDHADQLGLLAGPTRSGRPRSRRTRTV
jgi:uncharacterized damage-inducible protein DinB